MEAQVDYFKSQENGARHGNAPFAMCTNMDSRNISPREKHHNMVGIKLR